MNILPKKRWHVRTRENIARVRKDEQEAAEEAKEKKRRVLQAEQEARVSLLRQRARERYSISSEEALESGESPSKKHVNFFEELEEGKVITTKTNEETEKEDKEKKEKYEKQIGYLTYLGQDTVEATGNIPWYDKVPDHHQPSTTNSFLEVKLKSKLRDDPLTTIRKFVPVPQCTTVVKESSAKPLAYSSNLAALHSSHRSRKKQKKTKRKVKKKSRRSASSSDLETSTTESESDDESKKKCLEQLRAERLKRERLERERTEELLARLDGKNIKDEKKQEEIPVMQQKYNSQYNPDLAKQNYNRDRNR